MPGCAECTSELHGHAFNAAAVLKRECVVGQLGLGFSSQARWRGRGKGVAASVCTRLMRIMAMESLLWGKGGTAGRRVSERKNIMGLITGRLNET